jgi:hypothetical protein
MTTFEYTAKIENLNGSKMNENDINGDGILRSEDFRSEPAFPKATSILFNSGNVVQSDRLKRRANINPQEEVIFLNTVL